MFDFTTNQPPSASHTLRMKGPSRHAVQRAIRIMLESLNANNNLDLNTNFPLSLNSLSDCTEEYIRATRLVRRAVLREMDDRTTHRHRNSLLPVGRLPTELLVEIISFSATSSSSRDTINMNQLHLLSRVCFRWWRIVLCTPQLWTDIRAGNGVIVEHQIERSGSLPLSITFTRAANGLHAAEFMELVTDAQPRWRSLRVDATEEEWEFIEPYLKGRMPLLETAHLATDSEGGENLAGMAFGGGPKLRSLHLEGVEPRAPFEAFRSVTRLDLDSMWLKGQKSLPRLLAQFQGLTHLNLWGLYGASYEIWDAPVPPILVTLPHLQVLHYEGGFDSVWAPLFKGMCAKNLRCLHVEDSEHDSGFSLLAHPPIHPTRPTLLQAVLSNVDFESFTIHLQDGKFFISGVAKPNVTSDVIQPGSNLALKIDVGDCEEPRALQMLRHLAFPSVPMHLKLWGWEDPSALLLFPTVVSITSNGSMEYGENCISFLCNTAEETGLIACPLLSEIHFKNTYTGGERTLREVLEASGSFSKHIRRLFQTRRTADVLNSVSDVGRGLKVTCGQSYEEQYVFNEAAGRFIMDESI